MPAALASLLLGLLTVVALPLGMAATSCALADSPARPAGGVRARAG